ncbi:hypothetical protein KC19_10G002800 [Ceratodon purpureus]|uniref:Glycosyltransferase family 28 N-terminal domain-containing protein n=1 Tax=Ceratodon purpureus TaxID=3225 RepID=A0A8T0GHP5_CERPU|nr:hypothetical protein KC19_10G002800 [Ceratodon purpureus]
MKASKMAGVQVSDGNGILSGFNRNLIGLKEDHHAPLDLPTGSNTDFRPGQVNGDVSGHTGWSNLRPEKENQFWPQLEGGAAPDFERDNSKKTVNRQSPPSLKAMADRNSSEAHSASLPKVRYDDEIEASYISRPGIAHANPEDDIDNNDSNHPVQRTQSMPVWMPSVVATTISENAEEQAFEKIGDISLDVLRDDVDRAYSPPLPGTESSLENHLGKTISLTSMSSPDAAHRLPYTNNTDRRERKNTENTNIRNVADKFSDRKKKKLMKKLTRVQKDGTVDFDFGGSTEMAENIFGPQASGTPEDEYLMSEGDETWQPIPPLKVVMLIVGTRGDVQPFLAIGKRMQEYGHRVRLASHANFKGFVKTAGLEFHPLGGDPKVLAEYMVKNKGFLSTGPKEVKIQRKQIKAIVNSLLAPCIEPDMDTGVPFNAQVIIANPPAYGHVHVAEYLKIPLHIYFTMPWTPTSAFPHPLSRISKPAAFKLSYQVVDSMIWLGIRSIINDFRKKKLKLRPIPYLSSQGSLADLPTGYLWSPQLVPKPDDWGALVDVVGFCFLQQASEYKPPEDLVKWLEAGPTPIYVGFGSLPVSDPEGMTKTIIESLKETKQRGVINQGWGGLGKLAENLDFVYLVQDCPHDWLFPRCAGVVHHGGAGTVAAGLKAACPTTVVPFFGDQPFWGSRIYQRGVGPEPIPVDQFSVHMLVDAINFMLKPEVKEKAVEISKAMEGEDGVQGACDAFHKHIRKRIPEIMHETPPQSPPQEKKGHRFRNFCSSCWTCQKSEPDK